MLKISKQKIDLIRSLAHKKDREAAGLFVAEGEKLVIDLLHTSLVPVEVYFIAGGLAPQHEQYLPSFATSISGREMERISAFKTPSPLIALFKIPVLKPVTENTLVGINLVLDHVQDPGNLGTIVRMADWFGIVNIFCSKDCVDIFNTKSVQSTMGAIARVQVHYLDLAEILQVANDCQVPVYGTFMEGENLFKTGLTENALIVLGSEGKGISDGLEKFLTRRIAIPAFPGGKTTMESLNVAVSASIICAEFRRRMK